MCGFQKRKQYDLDRVKKIGNIISPAIIPVLMISWSRSWLQLLNHCLSFEPAEVFLGNRSQEPMCVYMCVGVCDCLAV